MITCPIFKMLQDFNKRAHIPDLHSFKAKIKGGIVFVECRGFEVYVKSFVYDQENNETRKQWAGTTIAAANLLESLGIDLTTVET